MLEVQNIGKNFGGVQALTEISFTVQPGELSSIIGPNGAGKTTLFHVISGYHSATEGRVMFEGEDITQLKPWAICRKGLCRSFQVIEVLPRLPVFRNVQLAVLARQKKTGNIFSNSKNMAKEEVFELLEEVGLADQADMLCGSMSQGDMKRLELAMVMASQPKLLLLDEPTAGMSPTESVKSVELIERLTRERGLTTLFTEHDMEIVFGISEKIRVMYFGKIVAEGTPDEIRNNEMVRNIYLGEET